MNINEVPQDKKNFKDGDKAPKKVMYVTTQDGSYTQTQSAGWEAENLALEQAWEEIETQLQEEKILVQENKVSPISYYMKKNRMDIPILASYVSMWQWRVKRHLKPTVFKSLSDSILKKYADAFNISIEELKNVD
jgi:hypothetical protein